MGWDNPAFMDECTCDHDREEHGYMGCMAILVEDEEECPCTAHWEE